jgi:hypothetical protein
MTFASSAQRELRRKYQNLKEEFQAEKMTRLQVKKCVIVL